MLSKSHKNHYTAYNEIMIRKTFFNNLKQVLTGCMKQRLRLSRELTIKQGLQQEVIAHKEG